MGLGIKKKTIKVSARHLESGITFSGYEIHIGETTGKDCLNPFSLIKNKKDGAISQNGLVMGSYVHGMFNNNRFRSFFIKKVFGINSKLNYKKKINKSLDEFSYLIQKQTNIGDLLNF